MNRAEHMQWCKDRALEYVDNGDYPSAVSSMTGDLGNHPETADHPGIMLGAMLLFGGCLNTDHEVRKFIEDFR